MLDPRLRNRGRAGRPATDAATASASAGGTTVRVAGVDQSAYLRADTLTMRLGSFDFMLSAPAVAPVVGDLVFVLEPAWDGQVVSVTKTYTVPLPNATASYQVTATNSKLAYASPAPFGLSDVPDRATTYPYRDLVITTEATDSGPATRGICTIFFEGLWPAMTFTLTSAAFGLVAAQYTVTDVTVTWLTRDQLAFAIEFGDAMVTLSAWSANQAAYAPDGSISGTKITDLSVTTPKLAANAVTAAKIEAGTITADLLSAVLVLASAIKTAISGARVEFDSAGFRAYATDGSVIANIPTDGNPISFIAQVQATTLTVTGNAEINGTANSLTKLSTLTLQAGVQPPNAAPGLSQGLGTSLTLAATAGWTTTGSGYYDSAGGSDGATACFVCAQTSGGTTFRVAEWKLSDGTLSRTTDLSGVTFNDVWAMTRIGASWCMTGVLAEPADAMVVTRSTGVLTAGWDLTGYFWNASASPYPQVGTDGTYFYISHWGSSALDQDVVKFSISPATYVSTTALALPTAPVGASYANAFSFTVANIGDGNGTCFWADLIWITPAGYFGIAGSPSKGRVYQFTTAGVLIANTDWADYFYASQAGILWDGTNFRQAFSDVIYTFTNWTWTTASSIYWVGYAWYEDAGTAHETAVGPRASITMERRRQLTITTATIPVGGADDPNKVRVYMLPNATDPAAGAFKLQATDALTVRTLSTYSAAGAADGTGTAFPGGTGAVLQSASALWTLRGDGYYKLGGTTGGYDLGGSSTNTTITVAGTYYALTSHEVSFTPLFVGQRWLFTFTSSIRLTAGVSEYLLTRMDLTDSSNVQQAVLGYSRTQNVAAGAAVGAVAISKVWTSDTTSARKIRIFGTCGTTAGATLEANYSQVWATPLP